MYKKNTKIDKLGPNFQHLGTILRKDVAGPSPPQLSGTQTSHFSSHFKYIGSQLLGAFPKSWGPVYVYFKMQLFITPKVYNFMIYINWFPTLTQLWVRRLKFNGKNEGIRRDL